MVKRRNIKGGTSLEDLNTFVNEVKQEIPYIDTDTIDILTAKIQNLLQKDRKYTTLLNKIPALTLDNYSTSVSEYILYTPETPNAIKNYTMPFIQKLIKLTSVNTITILEDIKKTKEIIYFSHLQDDCLYFYIVCDESIKYSLLTAFETNSTYSYTVIQHGSYLEIKINNITVANIININYTPPDFTNDNDTKLFMHLYEKNKRTTFSNYRNDLIIQNLLSNYNEKSKKEALLNKYKDVYTSSKLYLLLMNYLYPEFHNKFQDKITKILEKSILEFGKEISVSLEDTNSKIVLIGGASFNIVTGNISESINDFDFAIYSITPTDILKLYDTINSICEKYTYTFVDDELRSSLKKSSPTSFITYKYDISKIKFKVRGNKRYKLISIDLEIPEIFTINGTEYNNVFNLPIVDITIKDTLTKEVYDNISAKCELLLDDMHIGSINILSHFGLLYNINNTDITIRPLIKQKKDRDRWEKLHALSSTARYIYKLKSTRKSAPQLLVPTKTPSISVTASIEAAKRALSGIKIAQPLPAKNANLAVSSRIALEAARKAASEHIKAAVEKVRKEAAEEAVRKEVAAEEARKLKRDGKKSQKGQEKALKEQMEIEAAERKKEAELEERTRNAKEEAQRVIERFKLESEARARREEVALEKLKRKSATETRETPQNASSTKVEAQKPLKERHTQKEPSLTEEERKSNERKAREAAIKATSKQSYFGKSLSSLRTTLGI